MNRPHTEQPASWTTPTAGLASTITGTPNDALVFVLGAGCSLSSGCPSYDGVKAKLDVAPGRDGRNVEMRLAAPSAQRRRIQSMFEGCSPNIGYYCLAALARERRVIVLNLNWDNMVAQAAIAIGVECDSFDIQEIDDVEGPKSSPGLTVIHLHGPLAEPRFRLLDTAAFSIEQRQELRTSAATRR